MNDYLDLESFAVSKEMYDLDKLKVKGYYNTPIRKMSFPELSREDHPKKHLEYMKKSLK